MRGTARVIAGLLGLFVILTPPSAEIYRWVDEHGNTHFGDRPDDEAAQTVELDERALNLQAVPAERLQRQRKILDAYAEERKTARETAARDAEQAAARQQECYLVRDRLHQMVDGGGVWYDLDSAGNRVYLDDAQLQQQIANLRVREQAVCE